MSLINRMLQDLDARRADEGKLRAWPDEVLPLPAAPARRWPSWLAGVALLGAGLGSAAWYYGVLPFEAGLPPPVIPAPAPLHATAPVTPPAAPVAALPAPASAGVADGSADSVDSAATVSAAGAADAPSLPAPPPDAAASEPAREVAPLSAGLPRETPLRLTTSLRQAPAPKPSEKPTRALPPPAAPEKNAPVPEKAAPAEEKATVPAARSTAPDAAGPVVIEKTPAAGTPRERAENDYRKAIGILNLGRQAEAIDALRGALRQDAMHAGARQLLFRLLLDGKRLDDAAETLREGLRVQPAIIAWAMSLARLQADRGDFAAAWQTLQESLPAAGASADYQGFAAHLLQRLGRQREAAEYYATASRLAPSDGRWWLGLGLALDAEGRSTEAREAWLRARAAGNLSPELARLLEQKLY